MTEKMSTLPFPDVLDWILLELEARGEIFGIPRELFFVPCGDEPYATRLFDHPLATPIGPAAGPHTQLAQNIVAAWLCGGRFIELKTVQIMDELDIPRPCIDMEDEGYNVEWSQELRLHESLEEYVKAWVLIHVLRRELGFGDLPFGTIFNMSVGYNLEGILSEPMQRFMDRLEDAEDELEAVTTVLRERYARFADLEIPTRIVDSVTLSTMHGCPPEEIERIARYLIEERGLHTTVKLNPTLLGKEAVLRILRDRLGFRSIQIPDAVFAHDLQYDRALELIASLQRSAADRGVTFGVKLSNTLAMANHRGVLPGEEMYMSGRALYPITVNLFHRLIEAFDGDLNVSYSAGADALNVVDLLAAGARPVTVASDLLKPGGYGRFAQYLEQMEAELGRRGAGGLEDLASDRRASLAALARASLDDPRYRKGYPPHGLPKVASKLDLFDCIEPPCVAQCAVLQDVPEYAHWLALGEDDRALATILHRNPLPAVTGHVCTHRCQSRCTRNVYDEAVEIRRLKRFAVENGTTAVPVAEAADRRVAVIGSGPAGLAAAYHLATSGIQVTVYEAKDRPGGMLAIAPAFRLPREAVDADVARIEALGVTIECDRRVDEPPERLLADGFDAVFIGCGFPKDAGLTIDGADVEGVYGALALLERVARGGRPGLGEKVVVIGGGNTAMDAARTAQRLTGRPATVVYRRSRAEMPAEPEEIEDLLLEGNELLECASPLRVRAVGGRITGLDCVRNELGAAGEDGRKRPVPVPGTEFVLPATSILLATGQRPAASFLDRSAVAVDDDGRIRVDDATGGTTVARIYAGGDVARGPAIIIEACADGRRAAEAICGEVGVPFAVPPLPDRAVSADEVRRLRVAKARKATTHRPPLLPIAQRTGFDLVEGSLSEAAARDEARRCLQCRILCDRCIEVCPNRANVAIRVPIVDVHVPVVAASEGRLTVVGEEPVTIVQGRQILHVDDLCNACGNCTTFCTHEGQPYLDKPRLFLSREAYEGERDNAFFMKGDTLYRRDGGREAWLTRSPSGFTYETPELRIELSSAFSIETTKLRAPFDGTATIRPAVETAALYVGIVESAGFLPLPGRSGKERS